MTKIQHNDDNADAKAIAMPRRKFMVIYGYWKKRISKISGHELLIFRILLTAIDWNF